MPSRGRGRAAAAAATPLPNREQSLPPGLVLVKEKGGRPMKAAFCLIAAAGALAAGLAAPAAAPASGSARSSSTATTPARADRAARKSSSAPRSPRPSATGSRRSCATRRAPIPPARAGRTRPRACNMSAAPASRAARPSARAASPAAWPRCSPPRAPNGGRPRRTRRACRSASRDPTETRPGQRAFSAAIQSAICASSTSSGTDPWPSTASWKRRRSNFGPSSRSARVRSARILSSPNL